ncbi:glycosyl transferas [Lecanosticta acicola]|uniref:Glycosyl transferas n=1 Tax=Lecanosticta acicola TaxID=111012 RepID=A0AAI8YW75_9PEZI|nr:glycosyl transferas [Lecanosticta acicola]
MGVKGLKTASAVSIHQRRTEEEQQQRNVALKKAIGFAQVPLLTNLVYFAWRWFSVLKCIPSSGGSEIVAFVGFLLVEWIFAVSGLLNALLVSSLGKTWTPQEQKRAKGESIPRVDVFLPCYGEGLDIIKDTINTAVRQDYPKDKFRVVILDDGNSPAVRELVSEISKENPDVQLHYGARGREVKIHSKAANICYGMELVKTLPGGAAPYFGVVDIDMLLEPEWIRATVPFLEEDELVAMAGSPQKFYNLPQGFCLAPRFALESDVLQRVFDANGKAVCQGTGYLARTSTFEALGGFPTMVKQEDSFIVSIILSAHGYKVRLLEEEHQHGMNALTYTDMAKLQTKWMTGIIHAYSLFTHPILTCKPLGARVSGLIPVLHMTIFRLFLVLALPSILLLARTAVIPTANYTDFRITLALASVAYSSSYIMSWFLSAAANGNISLDDGTRLWNLPYQLKGVMWLVHHAIFGESKMPRFLTTGADCAASKKTASTSVIGRLWRTVIYDGGWMHMTYFFLLTAVISLTLRDATSTKWLLASIAFPPFTKILLDCLYNSITPIIYVLSPDPNLKTREDFLERDEKTGVARPSMAAITPPKPAFFGTLGLTGWLWAYFAVAPLWLATRY